MLTLACFGEHFLFRASGILYIAEFLVEQKKSKKKDFEENMDA
jgi:hypothetical protein